MLAKLTTILGIDATAINTMIPVAFVALAAVFVMAIVFIVIKLLLRWAWASFGVIAFAK